MPFTLAHAAAALPLRRFKLVWSAFVIGTFAPDFETFLTFARAHRDGHHFPGVFLFTLPSGLLVLWLFHRYLKAPLVELAPEGLHGRLVPYVTEFRFGGIRRLASIVASMALGIATHLLWDSFTHVGWLSGRFAWFQRRQLVPWFDGPHFPSHLILLQHTSSILGCAALVIWFVRWYRRASAFRGTYPPMFSPWVRGAITVALVVSPFLVGALLAVARGHEFQDFAQTHIFAEYLVIFPGSVLGLEIVIYAILANLLRSQRETEPA